MLQIAAETSTAPGQDVDTYGSNGPISTPMVAALEAAWSDIRSRHPEIPPAVVVLGAGSISARGGLTLGHFAAVVFVGGEGLRRAANSSPSSSRTPTCASCTANKRSPYDPAAASTHHPTPRHQRRRPENRSRFSRRHSVKDLLGPTLTSGVKRRRTRGGCTSRATAASLQASAPASPPPSFANARTDGPSILESRPVYEPGGRGRDEGGTTGDGS